MGYNNNEITMVRKTITINEDTHKELVKLGVYGESMDDIIKKLINHYHGKSGISFDNVSNLSKKGGNTLE